MPTLPWHAIKIPLLILLSVVLVAGTGVWWSSGKLREAKAAQALQIQANQSAEQTLQRSNTEKQLIQQYRGAYQTLVASGFIGAENRLAWLEAVQQANRDAHLYGVDYSLEPRTPASVSGMSMPLTPSTKTSLLGQTVMKLRMPILVEDDLTHFFDALQQRTSSLFRIRTCQMSRAAETAPQPMNRPELEVECELLWFTVAGTKGPAS